MQQPEKLEQYERTRDGEKELLFRCVECGKSAQGGMDNGFVVMLPYPHDRWCRDSNLKGKR